MAYSITSLAHQAYAYVDDANANRSVSMRIVYATLSGLTTPPAGGASSIKSHNARVRFIHSPNGGQSGTQTPVERKFPVAKTVAATPAPNTAVGGNIDGITNFVWKGYRGEKRHP